MIGRGCGKWISASYAHRPTRAFGAGRKLTHQTGLADARLTSNGNQLAVVVSRAGQRPIECRQFAFATNKRYIRRAGSRVHSTAACANRPQRENWHRFRYTFYAARSQGIDHDKSLRQSVRATGEQNLPRLRHLLHSRSEMHGRSVGFVLDGQVVSNGMDHDLARVQTDPNRQGRV